MATLVGLLKMQISLCNVLDLERCVAIGNIKGRGHTELNGESWSSYPPNVIGLGVLEWGGVTIPPND